MGNQFPGKVQTVVLSVTTTGGNGAASGQVESGELYGELLDVYLDYHATAPATTGVSLDALPNVTHLLTKNANNTDGLYLPRFPVCDTSGAAIAGSWERWVLNGKLRLSVAQSNALAPAVTATIRYLAP